MLQRAFALWRRFVGNHPDSYFDRKAAEDRRESKRFATDHSVQFRRLGTSGGSNEEAQLRDVSAGGISFLTEAEFRAGELLEVLLPEDDATQKTSALACVVHVGRPAEGKRLIGCAWSAPLGEEGLRALGVRETKADNHDQRAQPRHGCDIEAKYQLLPDESAQSRTARILNLSLTGVGLLLHQPMKVGQVLNLELAVSGQDDAHSQLCCAVHVIERAPGEWLVGCNFITELSDRQFRRLVASMTPNK
jgi:hypothetical protein